MPINKVRFLNFIAYRIINAGNAIALFALDIDNIHHFLKEDWNKYKQEDPFDMKRVTYPFNENSLIVDIGGFTGDWAMRMYCLYSCFIDIYEPHPVLAAQSIRNFMKNDKVTTYPFGLDNKTAMMTLYGDNMNASLHKNEFGNEIQVPIKRTLDLFNEKYKNKTIDLIKINAEGAEYNILMDLLENYDMTTINNIQIEFHKVIPDYDIQRNIISKLLSKTHKRSWNYDYVFENWELK